MDEIKQVDLESKDLVAERIEQMKMLFPEIATEGDGTIDFEKLRLILGDEVNENDERYAFTWPGKADAIRQSQTVSTATLRPCPEESVDWDTTQNLYIEGDNLEVLKLLQRGYHGKVKMIYIDPPYNTGNDFVYRDKFGDSVANYIEQAGLSGQSNAETSGRYHSDWCSMMYPRLKMARELLTDDGVIFVSIDDNEVDNLKKLMDEVFGEDNFAARFMWTKTMTPPALAYKCRKTVEYVLCYERISNNSKFFGDWLDNGDAPLLNSGNPDKTLVFPDHSIKFTFTAYETIPAGKYDGVQALDDIKIVDGWNAGSVRLHGNFKWQQSTLDEELESGTYFLMKTRKLSIRFQRPASDDKFKTPTNFLPIKLDSSVSVGTNETASADMDQIGMGGLFDFTKPKSLVRALIKMRCFIDKDDIICDFFSGSSTTAASIMEMNAEDGGTRRCISVQLPEVMAIAEGDDAKTRARKQRAIDFLDGIGKPHYLTEIGKERLRREGEKISSSSSEQLDYRNSAIDIGFRVFKLDGSCIEKPEQGQLIVDRIKPDRNDQDIIFEMMLKWGLELTYPIERTEINGYPCYSIAYDELICCMEDGLTVETIEAIAALQPRRVFMLDSILDDTLKLNALQIFKRVEEKTQQKIDLRTV